MHKFRTCQKCDFEWHLSDGKSCPVCERNLYEKENLGGVFGTAKNQPRINMWIKAFGLLALVYLIYSLTH